MPPAFAVVMPSILTVASYNIHKAIGLDRRRRPERIIEVLGEIGADIVALQEADRRFGSRAAAVPPHMLADHSDYRPVSFDVRAGSIGWHGNALLVRRDVEVLRHATLVIPALEPRGAVMADLRVGGYDVRVVGMHLDLSGLWRRRQARAILTHVAGAGERMPTVMMGDLNEWSMAAGCLRDFGHDHHFADTGPSFHVRHPVARLDRIMLSRGIGVEACGVHQSATARTASDHLPVWARLRL